MGDITVLPKTATIMEGDPDLDYDDEKYIVVLGGDSNNPTWEEYRDHWAEGQRPYIDGIRKAIEDANLIGVKASSYCNDHYFEFEDGTVFTFSWRAWGDLMQAIVGEREGYMAYYM